ncbi:MAG: glutamate--cysteine ligase [Granulosicoccus sp.]
MYSEVKLRADRLLAARDLNVLAGRKVGLEKESLRVSAAGGIAQTDHPVELGCALTHPSITTDFSEALLEMVTPPCDSAKQAVDYLTGIHQFIVDRLPEGENIWNTSMPCILRGGESVRIGEYGSSFTGQMKHAYRRGLGLRYGRRMQAIAGVHFNFSLPEQSWFVRDSLLNNLQWADSVDLPAMQHTLASGDIIRHRTEGYFQTMQNLLRIGWMVPYLFGASPAICTSFLSEGEQDDFDVWNESTRYAPHGTSLRMGEIGYRYRADAPIDLSVRHTDIDSYISDIIGHVTSEHPPYAALGVRDAQNQFQQLSASRLQIENEFYSTVRPKQIARSGELPIHALRERGIRYLELRSVDVNLFDPAGVCLEQIAMLELMMMFAWLADPEPLSAEAMQACTRNVQAVAHRGREPGLVLEGPEGEQSLESWGIAILDAIEPLAQHLDESLDSPIYMASLSAQRLKFNNPDLTPSAKMIAGIKSTGSFFEHAQTLSKQHHEWFKGLARDEVLMQDLSRKVVQSREKQAQLEAENPGEFEDFLADYLGQINPVLTNS